MINEKLDELLNKALNAPDEPGVYIMRNSSKKVIYVGKAKILKNRLCQYFRFSNKRDIKVQSMVDNVFDFEYIICTSEYEALILECSLIKQYQPKYNILLKDDKGYHYIKITNENWPRISAEHKTGDDNCRYLGPYYSMFSINNALDEITRIFKLPQCGKVFPRDIGKSRPCLNYSIGRCCAPCARKINQHDYNVLVDNAIEYLKKGKNQTIERLKKEMYIASDALEFEKASVLRDRINSIEKLYEKQHIYAKNIEEQDVIAIAKSFDSVCVEVFCFHEGSLLDQRYYFLQYSDDEEETRSSFIKSYYSNKDTIPKQITLDGNLNDQLIIEEWLTRKAGKNVKIHIPQKGEQLALVNMCKANAQEKLTIKDVKRRNNVLDDLAKTCGLDKIPEYIEAYDISHTAGSNAVGGMVVFKNGKPYKSGYKRFIIDLKNAGDDVASISEVISRRINEYKSAKNKEGFGVLPDLILLDGGINQLNAAYEVSNKEKFNVPMFGMVKDEYHKTRAMVSQNGEIQISDVRAVFTLISSIQDEVHRYSVAYHHNKNKKTMLDMELMKIEGVGKISATRLLQEFVNIEEIKLASIERLSNINGISLKVAEKIYNYYHQNN